MTTPSPRARPPVVAWFVRRAIGWTLVVWGSALPFMLLTWGYVSREGRFAQVLGVSAWTVAIIAWSEQRRWHGADRAPRILRQGAIAFLVFQSVGILRWPQFFGFAYLPTLWLAVRPPLIPAEPALFRSNLVLTVLVGAQVLASSWVLGLVVERVRSVRARHARAG